MTLLKSIRFFLHMSQLAEIWINTIVKRWDKTQDVPMNARSNVQCL